MTDESSWPLDADLHGDTPAEVVARIDAVQDGSAPWVVDAALRRVLPSMFSDWAVLGDTNSPPHARAAAIAFSYRVRVEGADGRPRVAAVPYIQGGLGPSPPELQDLDADVVACWVRLVDNSSSPETKAHLHTLLFLRGNGRQHAEAAVVASLESARRLAESIAVVDTLELALQLGKAIKHRELQEVVVRAMLDRAGDELDKVGDAPGVVFGLLRPLVRDATQVAEVDALLAIACERYPDAWNRFSALLMRLEVAAPDAIDELQRDAVQCWIDAGESADGLVRATHYRKALEVARRFARRDLEAHAAQYLQSLKREDLGLERHWVSVGIDERQLQQLIRPITDAETLALALVRFSTFGPISGDLDTNRETAAEVAAQSPFLQAMPTVITAADGMPRLEVRTAEERYEYNLTQVEAQRLQVFGPLVVDALSSAPRGGRLPPEAELTAILAERPLLEREQARVLSKCLIRFWTQDYDGAAMSVWPLIEAFARQLVVAADLGIYRLQVQAKPGQYPGLGFLLDALKGLGLDPSWHRFLYTLCVNPMGWNLRNDISHGFIAEPNALAAALLIQAALYLSSLEIKRDRGV